jgi:hypothetical protein
MKITYTGKRGGKKTVDIRTLPQLVESLDKVRYGYDRKHEQMMMVGLFIAERLIEIENALVGRRVRRGTYPSDWNRFFADGMRAGKSPTQIGADWQAQKVKKVS